jgi:hypothetical protein
MKVTVTKGPFFEKSIQEAYKFIVSCYIKTLKDDSRK